jgi:hypothetical protein
MFVKNAQIDKTMSNAKAQSSNEVQIPNFKYGRFDISSFGIQLAFACPPVGRDFDTWVFCWSNYGKSS